MEIIIILITIGVVNSSNKLCHIRLVIIATIIVKIVD